MTPRRMYTVWRRRVNVPVYGSAIGIFRPKYVFFKLKKGKLISKRKSLKKGTYFSY